MRKKIIVVDDSQVVRQQVRLALGVSFEVIEAEDGVEALEKLDSHQEVAMMICDTDMPRMNGLDLIEAVRRNPAHHLLPLMILSTEGRADWLDRAVKAGAMAWMVKPFKPDLLVMAVKKLTSDSLVAVGAKSVNEATPIRRSPESPS